MPAAPCNPETLNPGIRDAVVMLWKAGFKTFTSCEGGRGHPFRHETIGLEVDGGFAGFQRRLVSFLRAHGMQCFTVSLVTDFPFDPPTPHARSIT